MTNSAVWLTCRDCGDTTRVLALMANRVLKARTCCPACRSTCEPCLNRTPVGQGIALSAEQSNALREMDDKALRSWLEQRAHRFDSHQTAFEWMHAAGSRLAHRLSKAGRPHFAAGHQLVGEHSGSRRRRGGNAFPRTSTIGETGSAAIRL